jgi:hypothetical protein
MITKHGLFLGKARLATGFAVLLLAAIFTFTGCSDGDDGDDGGGSGHTGVGISVKLGADDNPFILYALKDKPTAANVAGLIAAAAGQSIPTTIKPMESIDFYWATGKQPADGAYYLVVISSAAKKAYSPSDDPVTVPIASGKTTTETANAFSWNTLE